MPNVPKSKRMEWASELDRITCSFRMCNGSVKPYHGILTCDKCTVAKDIRYHADGKPRLPEHPGYVQKEK